MDQFLQRLDLNLLKSLHVLLQERNVTRAAERMFVTQSAMSKTLKRLREALHDPLLVQSGKRLVPTPYADGLSESLQTVFSALEASLAQGNFSPEQCRGTIRIAAPETFALGLAPNLIDRLKRKAPNLHIELLHLPDDYLNQLLEGGIDFVAYLQQEYSDDYEFHSLFPAKTVICCDLSHPLASAENVTIEDLCRYPKIAFHSPNIPAATLKAILSTLSSSNYGEKSVEVLLTTSHLLVALAVLKSTDAIMVSPDFVVQNNFFPIKTHAIDHIGQFDDLSINVGLLQSKHTLTSPLHNWVVAEAKEI